LPVSSGLEPEDERPGSNGRDRRVKQVSGREFAKIIERHGWRLLRVQGSHHIYGKPGSTVRLSIPVHGNQPLKRGLLAHLMKLASLEENLLD
jgi:predicted RNA binding protein YcfA (HicA-like mRNA interferase family)